MRQPQRFNPHFNPHPFFSFFLAFSVLSLGCTSPTLQAPAVSINPSPSVTQIQSVAPQLLFTDPSAQIDRLPTGALRFSIAYPTASGQPAFRTQGLNYADFARFQVSIIGIGLPTPLYPVTANSAQNNTLPAVCDATRCALETRIENVPAGENRVALITAYDSSGQAIPGSTLAAAFTLPTNPNETLTVQLSYLSTPVGQVMQQLLGEGEHLLVSELDTEALQNFVGLLIGASGNSPEVSYALSPLLIDIPQLVQDLKAYRGDIAALSLASPPAPANLDYLKPGATITGSISGLVGNDKVKLRLTDPTSTPLFVGNGAFSFDAVPAGNWQVILENTQGYTVTEPPGNVTLEQNQSLSLPATTLTLVPNAPPDLANPVITPGGQIVLQSRSFNPEAASNTITITGNINSGGLIFGYWTVNATDVKEEDGLYSVAFPLPPEITSQWFNLKIYDPNEPISFRISSFHMLSLDRGAAVAGESLLLNGAFFDPLTSNLQVIVAGRTLPTANLTVLNDEQMQVQLPLDLPVGETLVEVSKSGEFSSYSPPLTLLSQAKNWSADWRVIPATAAEHVVTVASSALLPKRVWFGSKAEGTGSGGVWVCDWGASSVHCANPKRGADIGSIQAFAQEPYSESRVYAGSETQGFWRCLVLCDQEDRWEQSNSGLGSLNIRAIVVDPHEHKKIYVATAAGVYRSLNAGVSWSAYNTGLLANQQEVHSLSLDRPTILSEPVLYMGTAGAGIFRKVGTANWVPINTGIFSEDATSDEGSAYLESMTLSALEAHPVTPALLYGGGTGQYQILDAISKVGVWQRSETEGASRWTPLGRNDSNGFLTPGTGLSSMQVLDLAVDPAQPQHVYAATRLDGLQTGGVYRSLDAGVSWQAFNLINGGGSLNNANALALNHLRFYAGTPQGLFYAPY